MGCLRIFTHISVFPKIRVPNNHGVFLLKMIILGCLGGYRHLRKHPINWCRSMFFSINGTFKKKKQPKSRLSALPKLYPNLLTESEGHGFGMIAFSDNSYTRFHFGCVY